MIPLGQRVMNFARQAYSLPFDLLFSTDNQTNATNHQANATNETNATKETKAKQHQLLIEKAQGIMTVLAEASESIFRDTTSVYEAGNDASIIYKFELSLVTK